MLEEKGLKERTGFSMFPVQFQKQRRLVSNFCLRNLRRRCAAGSMLGEESRRSGPVGSLVSWNLATSKVLWLFINQTCATLKNIPAWVHLRNCITELTETVIQLIEVKVNFNFSRCCRRRKATCWIKRAFSMDAVKTSLEMMYLWKIPHPHTQESATQDKFSFNYS